MEILPAVEKHLVEMMHRIFDLHTTDQIVQYLDSLLTVCPSKQHSTAQHSK